MPDELWNEVRDIVQETGIKTIPMEKKCKKAKCLSGEALQIAVFTLEGFPAAQHLGKALVLLRLPAHLASISGTAAMVPITSADQRRKWQPTPLFLPGKSRGQRSLAGYGPQGCKLSTEARKADFLFSLCVIQLPLLSLSCRELLIHKLGETVRRSTPPSMAHRRGTKT